MRPSSDDGRKQLIWHREDRIRLNVARCQLRLDLNYRRTQTPTEITLDERLVTLQVVAVILAKDCRHPLSR